VTPLTLLLVPLTLYLPLKYAFIFPSIVVLRRRGMGGYLIIIVIIEIILVELDYYDANNNAVIPAVLIIDFVLSG